MKPLSREKIVANKRNRKDDPSQRYTLLLSDWDVRIQFNDQIYQRIFNDREFEERIAIEMTGHLVSTTSKKCKDSMAGIVSVRPSDAWYDRDMLRDDLDGIGSIEIMRADNEFYFEDTIRFYINVPTKSFDNMKEYISLKGQASITLIGTELSYRKGDIVSFEFGKKEDHVY